MNKIFEDNRYTDLYHRIIAKHGYQEKPGDGKYYERHHIIPRSMGGNDSVNNLTYVLVRVHFLLHVILAKAVRAQFKRRGRWCVICFSAINDKQLVRRKLNSRLVQSTREAHNADLKLLKWFNNGGAATRFFPEEQIPSGFVRGRLKLPSRAGVIYITDGISTKRIKQNLPIPPGWQLGQKPDRIKQISEQGKKHCMGTSAGRTWINNGSENKYLKADQFLPEGWSKGRLKTGKFDPCMMRSISAGTTGKTWKVTPSASVVQSPV
jgi:hypothetical protein